MLALQLDREGRTNWYTIPPTPTIHLDRRLCNPGHVLHISAPRETNPGVVALIQRLRNTLQRDGAQLEWTTVEYTPGRNPVFSQQGVDKVLQHFLRIQAPIGASVHVRSSCDDALAALRAQVYGVGTTYHGPVAWLQTEAWDAIHIPIKFGGGPLAWSVAQGAARATSARVGLGSHGLLLLGAMDGAFGALFRALQNACPHCLPGQGGPAALMPRRASIFATAPGQSTVRLSDPLRGSMRCGM